MRIVLQVHTHWEFFQNIQHEQVPINLMFSNSGRTYILGKKLKEAFSDLIDLSVRKVSKTKNIATILVSHSLSKINLG